MKKIIFVFLSLILAMNSFSQSDVKQAQQAMREEITKVKQTLPAEQNDGCMMYDIKYDGKNIICYMTFPEQAFKTGIAKMDSTLHNDNISSQKMMACVLKGFEVSSFAKDMMTSPFLQTYFTLNPKTTTYTYNEGKTTLLAEYTYTVNDVKAMQTCINQGKNEDWLQQLYVNEYSAQIAIAQVQTQQLPKQMNGVIWTNVTIEDNQMSYDFTIDDSAMKDANFNNAAKAIKESIGKEFTGDVFDALRALNYTVQFNFIGAQNKKMVKHFKYLLSEL